MRDRAWPPYFLHNYTAFSQSNDYEKGYDGDHTEALRTRRTAKTN